MTSFVVIDELAHFDSMKVDVDPVEPLGSVGEPVLCLSVRASEVAASH